MCAAALISMRDVKVWRGRALVRRHTYGESACWYACQVAKLSVPLSYNFITFVPKEIYRETTFYQFLGKLINLTPLGTGFSSFFPIFILVPVLATTFNLYGKVKAVAGFGILDDDDEDEDVNPGGIGTGNWREGKTLIDRYVAEGGFRRTPVNNASLGLTTRDHSPASIRDVATTYTPALSSRLPGIERAPARRPASNLEEPADGGGFFSDLAHRVRNTVDTIERPEWVQELSSNMGKRPKWMGGAQENSNGDGGSDIGRGIGRLFGGRGNDGRVRL